MRVATLRNVLMRAKFVVLRLKPSAVFADNYRDFTQYNGFTQIVLRQLVFVKQQIEQFCCFAVFLVLIIQNTFNEL